MDSVHQHSGHECEELPSSFFHQLIAFSFCPVALHQTLKLFRNRPDKHKQICGTRTLSQRYKSLHVQIVPAMKVQISKNEEKTKKGEKTKKKKRKNNAMALMIVSCLDSKGLNQPVMMNAASLTDTDYSITCAE